MPGSHTFRKELKHLISKDVLPEYLSVTTGLGRGTRKRVVHSTSCSSNDAVLLFAQY